MPFFITLASGRDYHYADPTPDAFCAEDIAHHLSRENRWSNNIEPVSFSIAQHSLLVAQACERPDSRPYALLHDAVEMVIRDLPTPFKGFLFSLGADLVAYERRVMEQAVYPAFNLAPPSAEISRDVHRADQIALATEFRDIVQGKNENWQPKAPPLKTRVKYIPQPKVEEMFLEALRGTLRPFGKVA